MSQRRQTILTIFVGVGLLRKKFQMLLTFSQNLTLQEAFETAAPMHEELIKTEFEGAFCQKFKLLVDRFS